MARRTLVLAFFFVFSTAGLSVGCGEDSGGYILTGSHTIISSADVDTISEVTKIIGDLIVDGLLWMVRT